MYKKISTFAEKLKVKMKYLLHLIKTYPLSWCLIVAIWLLCLMPVPETPLSNVKLIDKWAHVSMYAVMCTAIWAEYLKGHKKLNKKRLFIGVWVAAVLMSGLIEVLQATCTNGNRSGDWMDMLANTIGATVGSLIGMLLAKMLSKDKKA